MAVKHIGGENLQHIMDKFKTNKPMRLEYGYFSNSTYPDGTRVASVAAWNEFGTSKIPERPFFRHANKLLKKELTPLAKVYKQVNKGFVNALGEMALNNLKQSILGFGISYTPNSPMTIKLKGSSKPLVDTGRLLGAGAYKVTTL